MVLLREMQDFRDYIPRKRQDFRDYIPRKRQDFRDYDSKIHHFSGMSSRKIRKKAKKERRPE